jgi:hypothetical protein
LEVILSFPSIQRKIMRRGDNNFRVMNRRTSPQ